MVSDMYLILSLGIAQGLNPCFSGIWSLTEQPLQRKTAKNVLILVLVEYGL